MSYHPGEIYRVGLPLSGEHPFVVVSREELNRGKQVVAAMITSAKFNVRSRLPNSVPLRAGQFGMTEDSVVQCENLVAIETNELRGQPLARLDAITMRALVKALGYVLDADCEPT
jgi:mRNA-degrading endonuclease toxin of MazEF toxin-antitoxin module